MIQNKRAFLKPRGQVSIGIPGRFLLDFKLKKMYHIYNVIFKKIKLYVNNYIGVFFSKPIGKNCELKFNIETNNMILEKFNVQRWDLCEGNYLHLKFLVTYSPILSKFIDPSEFDDIKVIKPSNGKNEFLIKFKCKDFYNVNNAHYIGENIMISERNSIFNEV